MFEPTTGQGACPLQSPDDKLNCILIHPRFSDHSYWNYKRAIKTMGIKAPSSPLGLITVAALLPQHWSFKVMDLNIGDWSEADFQWADVVCVGGMLPQQIGILDVIKRAQAAGKYVVAGGADPSSQPAIYQHADTLIVGEGETVIPLWMESWRNGKRNGVFSHATKPDVTKSPVPRFDLLDLDAYMQVGIQYSRGCPFNCEFCDIIELFGRVPRTKTPAQIVNELETLRKLGYRGSVELVDDNFIGNKRAVKRDLLPAIIAWNKKKRYPFYFSTESSMNLGDDDALLDLMRAAEFRYVFVGIETPDPELLLKTQKSQNTMKPIADRIRKINSYGITVLAGFIMGFDGEKEHTDQSLIRCIEDTAVCMAMVGLLVALPNTQLTRRLQKEGRLLNFQFEPIASNQLPQDGPAAAFHNPRVEVSDQTTAGINFVTLRPREEVLNEFCNVVRTVYAPKAYMDRVMRAARRTWKFPRHLPRPKQFLRNMRGLVTVCWEMSKIPVARVYFWRNFFRGIFLGPYRFEIMMRLMGMYLHFEPHTRYTLANVAKQISASKGILSLPLNGKASASPLESDLTPGLENTPADLKHAVST